MRYRNRLPREVVESLSLEVFKKHGGVALMCMGGGWRLDWLILEVFPTKWFYDLWKMCYRKRCQRHWAKHALSPHSGTSDSSYICSKRLHAPMRASQLNHLCLVVVLAAYHRGGDDGEGELCASPCCWVPLHGFHAVLCPGTPSGVSGRGLGRWAGTAGLSTRVRTTGLVLSPVTGLSPFLWATYSSIYIYTYMSTA